MSTKAELKKTVGQMNVEIYIYSITTKSEPYLIADLQVIS